MRAKSPLLGFVLVLCCTGQVLSFHQSLSLEWHCLIRGDEFTFWGLKMCIFTSCCPPTEPQSHPMGLFPSGCLCYLLLFLIASHPVIPMPGPLINHLETQMSPCHLTGCATFLYLQADAHGFSQQHQIRAGLCFSLTDILEENLFSLHSQGGFPSNPLHRNPRTGDPGAFPVPQQSSSHSG